MSRIRRAALTLALCLTAITPTALLDEPAPAITHPAPECHEDMPCWDWRTMGNRCGRDSMSEPIVCMP